MNKKVGGYKAHRKVFMLGIIVMLVVFLTSFASALEFDNVKTYYEETKIVTITNAFDFPLISSKIAEIQLKSEQEVQVGLGYQKVFEYEINSLKEYSNFIQELEIYNLKAGNIKENKRIDLKYLTYETIDVPIYETTCKELAEVVKGGNSTECTSTQIGTEKQQREKWVDISKMDVKVEKITISGWTDVKQGDYYEWVPQFAGVKVTEWATWSGNLSTNLKSYYKLDETSGTTATDSHGSNNGTISGATVNQTGKIDKAYDFDGSNDYVNLGIINFGKVTLNAWVYPTSSNGRIFSRRDSLTNGMIELYIESTNKLTGLFRIGGTDYFLADSNNFSYNEWSMVSFVYDGETAKLYKNGNQVASDTKPSGDLPNLTQNIYLGALKGLDLSWLDGKIDEVGIWNRSLTTDEIALLYNNGDGCAYGNESCFSPPDNPPTITLNSPSSANYTSNQNLQINFSAIDGIKVENVSLIINGVINQTNTSGINGTYLFNVNLGDGDYNISGRVFDNSSQSANSSSIRIVIDTLKPQFTDTTLNVSTIYNVGDPIRLNTTITDTNLDTCWYNYNNANTTFVCTSGVLNEEDITTIASQTNIRVWANDSLGNTNYSELLTFAYDTTPPTILITSGNGTQNYGDISTNHTLNITFTDTNLDNCWINYNGTNQTFDCTSGVDSPVNFTLQYNLYNATIWANDSLGNINNRFVEWNYNVLFLNASYDAVSYETQSQNFVSHINYNTNASLQVLLNYDSTNYTTTNTGSGSYGIYSPTTFEAPFVSADTNKTFFWIIIYNSSVTYSSELNQTVKPIVLILCNGTYTNKTLNYTFIDEATGIPINANTNPVTFRSTFRYWFGSGLNYKNYSYQIINTTTTNNFSFCISPANYTFYTDIDLQYDAQDYGQRTLYARNESLTNVTQNISLYVLLSTSTQKFTIYLKQGIEPFTDVLTEVYKYFVGDGIYKLVTTGLSDDKGTFVANLDLDEQYKFIPSKDGYTYDEQIKQASCSVAPCEITLNIGDVVLSAYEDFYNYFAQNVEYNLTYNKSSSMVTLQFLDKIGTAEYWRLWVYQTNFANDTLITICDENTYSISGTMTCNYSSYDGDITAKVYISRSPEKLVDFINFVNENITEILGLTGILASIIIFLVIVFSGIRNPVNIFILIPFALVVLKFIGLLPLDWSWILALTIFDIWIITRLKT